MPLVLLLALGLAAVQAVDTIERASAHGGAVVADAPDTSDSIGDARDAPDMPDASTLTWMALVALVVLGAAVLAIWRLAAGAGDRTSSPFRSGGEPCRAPPTWQLL
jgi:hypothetical protein